MPAVAIAPTTPEPIVAPLRLRIRFAAPKVWRRNSHSASNAMIKAPKKFKTAKSMRSVEMNSSTVGLMMVMR